jgi:chaperone modulatory protein CbpM
MTTYALTRAVRLDLDSFARAAGLHPETVRRFVALGLIDAARDAAGRPWFTRADLATVARIQRLRAGFALNYAALGLVMDLLDRVARLEAAQRRGVEQPASTTGARRWT